MIIRILLVILGSLPVYNFSSEYHRKAVSPFMRAPVPIFVGSLVLVPTFSPANRLVSPMFPAVQPRFFSNHYAPELHVSLVKQLIDDKSLPELSALLPLGNMYDTKNLYVYALDKGFYKGALLLAAVGKPHYQAVVQETIEQDHAIHIAARFDDLETLKNMVSRGVDIEETDLNGCTPLHVAAGRGNVASLICLLSAGACVHTVDNNYQGVMHHAVLANNFPSVSALLRAGAPVNVISYHDQYPDTLAMKRGHYALAPLLQFHDENALLQAIYYKDLQEVQRCLALGYRPDMILADGSRPIDAAFRFYHKEIIHELMKAFEFYLPA